MRKLRLNHQDGFMYLLAGHIAFIILCLLSIYFYKERILFSDSVFQFFKLINYEKLNVEASRYGAIIPQLPVLGLLDYGLSLKSLTILYSLSFILWYYLLYILCGHWLKNIPAALSIVFAFTLCISKSFYHPVTETHQALVYAMVLFAVLQYKYTSRKWLKPLLALVFTALTFLSHPMGIFPLVFLVGLHLILSKNYRNPLPYVILVLVFAGAFIKVILTKEGSYEGKFFSVMLNSPEVLLRLHEAASTRFFVSRAFKLYLLFNLAQLALMFYYLFRKKTLLFIWQAGFVFLFLIVTFITYQAGDADLLMERSFMPLAILVSLPFLIEVIPLIKQKKSALAIVLLCIALVGINRITKQGLRYKERTTFNQNLLKKTAKLANRKIILPKSELDAKVTTFWSNSFESLMLSTIDINVPTQTIFPSNDPASLSKYTESGNSYFLGADFWLEWNIKDLNSKYFSLPSDQPYIITSLEELENL